MLPAPLASVASTVKVKATSWPRLTTHKTVMRFAYLRQRALSLVLSGRQIVGHIFYLDESSSRCLAPYFLIRIVQVRSPCLTYILLLFRYHSYHIMQKKSIYVAYTGGTIGMQVPSRVIFRCQVIYSANWR